MKKKIKDLTLKEINKKFCLKRKACYGCPLDEFCLMMRRFEGNPRFLWVDDLWEKEVEL